MKSLSISFLLVFFAASAFANSRAQQLECTWISPSCMDVGSAKGVGGTDEFKTLSTDGKVQMDVTLTDNMNGTSSMNLSLINVRTGEKSIVGPYIAMDNPQISVSSIIGEVSLQVDGTQYDLSCTATRMDPDAKSTTIPSQCLPQ